MSDQWSPGQCVNCKGMDTADVRANSAVVEVLGLAMTIAGFFICILLIPGILLMILGRPRYARVCRSCGHQIAIQFRHRKPLSLYLEDYARRFNALTFEQKFAVFIGAALLMIAALSFYWYRSK